MKELKLSIDLLPKGAWGNDLSQTLSKKNWDVLRDKCYERANHSCQICGCKTDELDAHEVWDFDIENKTQTLRDIVALCSKCHGVKHFRNSQRLGFGENAKRHFLKVNQCSELDFAAHCAKAGIDFDERNTVYRWKMKADLDKFGGTGVEVRQRNIPLIENPYEHIDWEKIKYCETKSLFTFSENEENLGPPSICFIDVDQYQGKIIVVSKYSSRVEWFLKGESIKTKFNISGKFRTELKVEDLECAALSFKLTGEGGTLTSQVFHLSQST